VSRPPTSRRATGRRLAAGGVAIAAVALAVAWIVTRPRSPETRLEAARELVAAVRVNTTAEPASLVAGTAIADFGVGNDVRLVRVRIVDAVQVSVAIETATDVTLAEPLRLCLVGPYSAPDDAGLSDRCWGTPDLGPAVTSRLPTDDAGRPVLRAGQPAHVSVALRRGDVRCDYAPGAWRLEVTIDPLIDGVAGGAIALADVAVDVPFDPGQALRAETATRYCGLAETIYRDQGEPALLTP
jgi:hypothetical protein